MHLLETISQLVHSPFSEQAALKSDINHSFKNGISNTPLWKVTSPITNKRTTWNPIFATDEWLLVLTKREEGILNNSFFLTEEAMINKRLLHFLSFVYFKTRSAWETIHALKSR